MSVCMCACVQLPRADCVLRFSIENASKRLDYPTVVYRRAVLAFCLPTDSRTPQLGSAMRAGSHLPVGKIAATKSLVQLHNRLPRGSQAAWRCSRLRNVVDDQRAAVEHKHTYRSAPSKHPVPCKRPPPIFRHSTDIGGYPCKRPPTNF